MTANTVGFTQMADGTAEDYELLDAIETEDMLADPAGRVREQQPDLGRVRRPEGLRQRVGVHDHQGGDGPGEADVEAA